MSLVVARPRGARGRAPSLIRAGVLAPRIQNEKMSFVSMYGALLTFRFSWMR